MLRKNLVDRLAITSRRKGFVTALVYGLSLGVRFTSAAGEEVEIPAQAVQRTSPVISISAQLPYQNWGPSPALPVTFNRGWASPFGDCRAACENPMPMSSAPNCRP
ncbi:hypothetical protein EOW77_0009070 [Bradyrhizobium yuanmingense]|nr:hypothetical protein EOW77_0009070 [Bradyrhizobium yuanmingense]